MCAAILNVNREGIEKFEEGRIEGALHSFCRALSACEVALNTPRPNKDCCPAVPNEAKKGQKARGLNLSACIAREGGIVVIEEGTSAEDHKKKVPPKSSFHVSTSDTSEEFSSPLVPLSSPLVFVDKDQSLFDDNYDRMDQEERTLILGMISIFNVALTTHIISLMGSKTGGNNYCRKSTTRIRMKTSLKLYECAYLLLMKVEKKQRTNNSSLFLIWRRMLMFSILYGMGSIHREFQNSRESRDCFDLIFVSFIGIAGQDGIKESDFPPYFNLDVIVYDVFRTLNILEESISAPCA